MLDLRQSRTLLQLLCPRGGNKNLYATGEEEHVKSTKNQLTTKKICKRVCRKRANMDNGKT